MQKTPIEWTDFSASLLKYRDADGKSVHACVKISPGCAHCYAEAIAGRWEPGRRFTLPMTNDSTPFFDEEEARKILRSKSIAGQMMFVDDMTDWCGDWVPDEIIDQHFGTFALRPDVTFQVLTKRARRLREHLNKKHGILGFGVTGDRTFNFETSAECGMMRARFDLAGILTPVTWPLPNVHLGVSVEDQQRADERIPDLLATPAATRFLSCEPLLGPIELTRLRPPNGPTWLDCLRGREHIGRGIATGPPAIDWVIVGGESGKNARPCDVHWIRSIIKQCEAAGVPCFVKQLGSEPELSPGFGVRFATNGPTQKLLHPKGGDPAEWPADLRIREFPHAVSPRPESSRGALTRRKGARP